MVYMGSKNRIDKIEHPYKLGADNNAPEDFKCIWEKQINSNLGGISKTATEKLFTI